MENGLEKVLGPKSHVLRSTNGSDTTWSVLSFEVPKCDTNISPRRLITHLLHQMVHYRTNRRGSGHWSTTITRDNISTTSQTKMWTKFKITSESCAIGSFLWRPQTTGKVGCGRNLYSTSSTAKFGSSSEENHKYNSGEYKCTQQVQPHPRRGITHICTG